MRLDGANISTIAEQIGCSYQTICNFLKKIPKVDRPVRKHPSQSNKRLMAICADYLAGASIGTLAKTYRLSEQEIAEILSYIAERKPIPVRNTRYPAVTDWMNLNGYTVASFAALLDISPSKFIRIINGRSHMRYELASKIRDVTGLPFQKIFNKMFNQDEPEPGEGSLNPPGKLSKEVRDHG